MAFIGGECFGIFPLLDVSLRRDFRRHPMVGAGIKVKMPCPFVFDGYQLIDVGGAVIENDSFIIRGDPLFGHADSTGAFGGCVGGCFRHYVFLRLKLGTDPIFVRKTRLVFSNKAKMASVPLLTGLAPLSGTSEMLLTCL